VLGSAGVINPRDGDMRNIAAVILEGTWLTADRVRRLAMAAALGTAGFLLFLALTAQGLSDYTGRPLGTDFSSFYAAGRLAGRREEVVKVERPRIIARTGTDNLPVGDYVPGPSRMTATRAPAEPSKAPAAAPEPQIDYLDIPAFLRRQAD